MDTEIKIISKRSMLLFFGFFSVFSGYAVGNRLLICFGFGMLWLLFFTWHAAHNFFRDFSAQRHHYKRTFENQELRIRILLQTESRIPLYMLEVIDIFPAGDMYRIKTLVSDRLDNRSAVELEYFTICTRRRGVYVLGPIRLVCSDPLGIHKKKIELPVLTDLLIYPQAPDLKLFEVLGEGTLSQVGMETVFRPGHSEEFTGLREYRRGDNPRRIHWRSSARHNKLLVKEFREDVVTEVTFFLDMHRLSLSGIGDITSVEYIIKAAAAIARVAIEKSHLVQVFILSKKIDHIPLGGGYSHLITLLDRFTFLRPRGERTFEQDLIEYIPHLKPGSTVVLIAGSTNIHVQELAPILRQLMDKRIKLSVVLVDDRSFLKVYKDQECQWKESLPIRKLGELLIREGCGLFILVKGDDVAAKLQQQVSWQTTGK